MFKNKSILITGGTGSFGKNFIKTFLKKYPDVRRLIVYSRDEQKQFVMSNQEPFKSAICMRYLIGDVRDLSRLKRAFEDVDFVVHAAAMKHVHIAEFNPDECIKTNVIGAQNVISAALELKVKKVVALSTDKACAPINLYGATKLTSDKLFVAANNLTGSKSISFSVVRYGNVIGSNGSVVPFFLNKRNEGEITITHPEMTRFNITLDQGIDMVINAFKNSMGGEIFIPKIPSYKILDVVDAIAPSCKKVIVGIRPGEKIHEQMISPADSYNTYDIGNYYVILPTKVNWNLLDFVSKFNAKKVKENFSYSSDSNSEWETVDSLRELIVNHLDPNFKPL
jgi:UDP-N-acetylglucosamine 4,6-dehydratase (inverting)